MAKFSFLHFSDVHWSEAKRNDISIVRDALLNDLGSLMDDKGVSIDFVVCTGDLVQAGEKSEDFDLAHAEFVESIIKFTNLDKERYFICAGNHDISRSSVRKNKILENGLKVTLNSTEEVNRFIDDARNEEPNALLALDRCSNFTKYQSVKSATPSVSHALHRSYVLNLNGMQVLITSFNNSWRSSGESGNIDNGKLLLGERNADDAISSLPDADVRIALFHHPLSWLCDFDELSVEQRLSQNYDIMAFGHLHGVRPEARQTISGKSVFLQAGSIFAERKHLNSYHVVTVDSDTGEVELQIRTYFDGARRFGAGENVAEGGVARFSYQPKKKELNVELEKYLRDCRPVIRQKALEQFNISDLSAIHRSDPHSAYIVPPLFHSSGVFSSSGALEETAENEDCAFVEAGKPGDEANLSALLRSGRNLIFTGDREIGKTSLAHYCSVLLAEGASGKPVVPVIVSSKIFKGSIYELGRAVSNYLPVSKSGFDLEKSLASGELTLLIDNFSGENLSSKREIIKCIENYPNIRWLLFSTERLASMNPKSPNSDYIDNFDFIKIKPLKRRLIRELTHRWCDITGSDRDTTYELLMEQIRTSDLPKTGYIVTLLLWAMHAERRLERINESVLIMNMADYLLGKADFSNILREGMDVIGKEIVLSSVAMFMKDNGGQATPNQLLTHLIDFFRTKALNTDASEAIQTLVACGILSRTEDYICFKYQCFEEYYAAKHIGASHARLTGILNSADFLRYSREIEIHSGLSRENDSIVEILCDKIKSGCPEDLRHVDLSNLIEIADQSDAVHATKAKLNRILNKNLSREEMDDIVDEAEARLSENKRRPPSGSKMEDDEGKPVDSADYGATADPENKDIATSLSMPEYRATLILLGRVLRNSDYTDASYKIIATEDYFKGSAKFSLFLLQLAGDVLANFLKRMSESDRPLSKDDRAMIVYSFKLKLFSFMCSDVGDNIATAKLCDIFDGISKDSTTSLTERIFSACAQLDSSDPNWVHRWKIMIDDNAKDRVFLDIMAEKLLAFSTSKTAAVPLRKGIEEVTYEIKRILGAPKSAKGSILKGVRAAVALTEKDD
ncbi:metallophosphoesterase [Thioclava sp. GXIMD2076]|uniref:metallophosphoesterase n=1 Tax=Thioclava sp. GXIMD2076 TaxID=3131931 RepID=UPI0030CFC722